MLQVILANSKVSCPLLCTAAVSGNSGSWKRGTCNGVTSTQVESLRLEAAEVSKQKLSFITFKLSSLVTPTGSHNSRPLEVEDGEAGFALLFPKMDEVKIQTFHIYRDSKTKGLDESRFAEAGK